MRHKAQVARCCWSRPLAVALLTGWVAVGCDCGGPTEQPDPNGCTAANHCQLVDGAASCESGYDWLDPDPTHGDYRCVPVGDTDAGDAGGSPDARGPDSAAPRDAGLAPDAAVIPDRSAQPDTTDPTDAAGPVDAERDAGSTQDRASPDRGAPPDAAAPDRGPVVPGTPQFEFPYSYPGLEGHDRLVGDLNSDGHLDAVAMYLDYDAWVMRLEVSLDQGDRTFRTTHTAEYEGNYGGVTGVGDFDGDGALDLVIWSGGEGTMLLWGQGDGRFVQPAEPIEVPGSVFADFDNDGDADAFSPGTTGYDPEPVTLYRSAGDGTFTAVDITTGGAESVRHGDLNGDGLLDVAVVRDYPRELHLYLAQPDGRFTYRDPGEACAVCESFGAVYLFDLDADGRDDLVVTQRDEDDRSGLGIHLTGADQRFTQTDFVLDVAPFSMTAGDVDGDGHVDLVVVADGIPNISGAEAVAVLYGDGAGIITAVRRYPNLSDGDRSARLIDENGDRRADLLIGGRTVYAGGAARELRAPRLSPWRMPGSAFYYATRFSFTDMNGDTLLDGFSSYSPSFTTGYLGADLRFADALTCRDLYESHRFPNSDLLARDLTGDGVVDLHIAGAEGKYILVGRGGCGFDAPVLAVPGGAYAQLIHMNDDALPDALWMSDDAVQLAMATGGGAYGAPIASPVGSYLYSFVAGDLSGDGHVDIVGHDYDHGSLLYLTGDGAGSFSEQELFDFSDMSGGGLSIFRLLDFERDGDLDLLVADWGGEAPRLLINDGRGNLEREALDLGVSGFTRTTYALADFTGDGRLELLQSGQQEGRIFRLDGALTPTELTRFRSHGWAWGVDLDGDGDADLVHVDDYDGVAVLSVAPNLAVE